MSDRDRLAANEIRSLHILRSVLAEAERRVTDSTVAGRHLAVMMLDSAVEMCLAMGLGRYGDAPRDNNSLNDIHSRFVQAAGEKPEGWREAQRLRRVRNDAHHHQISVDPEVLRDLHPPVVRFVHETVTLAFRIALDEILLADAIRDPDLSDQIREAEEALADGEAAKAVAFASRALGAGRMRWKAQIGSGSIHHDEFGLAKTIEEQVGPVRELVEIMPFAPDLAEAIWFDHIKLEAKGASIEDARRAVRFVVDWIVRWEAHLIVRRVASERTRRYMPTVAPSRQPDGRPEWDGQPIVNASHGSVVLSGKLRCGPPGVDEDERRLWWASAQSVLTQARQLRLDDDTLTLTADLPDDADESEVVVVALRGVDEVFAAVPAEAAIRLKAKAEAIERERRSDEILDKIRSATGGRDSLFIDVTVRPQPSGGTAPRTVAFQIDVAAAAQDLPPPRVGHLLAIGSRTKWDGVPLTSDHDAIVDAAREIAAAIDSWQQKRLEVASEVARRNEKMARAVEQFFER